MESQEVVHGDGKSCGRGKPSEGVMRAMPVVVVEERVEAVSALSGVGVYESVSPFAKRGLNEAFGFAVCLRRVRAGEALFKAKSADLGAHGF